MPDSSQKFVVRNGLATSENAFKERPSGSRPNVRSNENSYESNGAFSLPLYFHPHFTHSFSRFRRKWSLCFEGSLATRVLADAFSSYPGSCAFSYGIHSWVTRESACMEESVACHVVRHMDSQPLPRRFEPASKHRSFNGTVLGLGIGYVGRSCLEPRGTSIACSR